MLTVTPPGTVLEAIDRLALFGSVFDEPIGRQYRAVLQAAIAGDSSTVRRLSRLLTVELVGRVELSTAPAIGSSWHDWLLDRILGDNNVLLRKLERAPVASVGETLRQMATDEIEVLSLLYQAGESALAAVQADSPSDLAWGSAQPISGSSIDTSSLDAVKRDLAARLESRDTAGTIALLAEHARNGLGLFGRYRAFRWTGQSLVGIGRRDPVKLADLVGYDRERRPVMENTRQFVAGLPANDVLLSGARGTGKSSTVKALLNEFGERGLRVVEVPKEHLADLSAILETISGRPERFILFVDDLSFEDGETHYKALKALLEGTIEARPANVVIYATSNRRNLITERWGERAQGDDEVNPRERLEEKLSLADRFGVRVFFPSPDQEHYLAIVESLARSAGIALPVDELRQRAIRWELLHSGRSGRVARQFVIALLGENA